MADSWSWVSALAGVGVTLLCAAVWRAAAAWARGGSSKRFLVAHLGGMGIRLLLALGLSVWALAGLDLRPKPFLGALLGSYALLLALEVLWLQRGRGPAGGAPAATYRERG